MKSVLVAFTLDRFEAASGHDWWTFWPNGRGRSRRAQFVAERIAVWVGREIMGGFNAPPTISATMLEYHPFVETPEAPTSIWRYMALDKFIHLLGSAQLWFAHRDTFRDGWEGRYSPATEKSLRALYGGSPSENVEQLMAGIKSMNEDWAKYTYVNCWHISEEESAALWLTYSVEGKCVAVKSSIERLRNSLQKTTPTIFAGRVKYIDYESAAIPWGNMLSPYVYKRRSFSYENELRLIYIDSAIDVAGSSLTGIGIPVDLNSLVSHVYLPPHSDDILRGAVQSVLDKFGLPVPLVVSNIFSGPK